MENWINCREYMKCERQPGGRNVEGLGECPARDQPTEKFNWTSQSMAYSDQQESQFREFKDQIQTKAREPGIVLKSAELKDW